MKIAQNNLDVQIALIEAQLGVVPNIQWCVDATKNPKTRRKFAGMSRCDLESELCHLRGLKVKQKLFWIQRELARAAKKAKLFITQRIIKKMKAGTDAAKEKCLENELLGVKALQHQAIAEALYQRVIVNSENLYVRAKLSLFGPVLDVNLAGTHEENLILEQKIFKTATLSLVTDLEQFLRKLLHDPVSVPSTSETGDLGASYFVGSLNGADHSKKKRSLKNDDSAPKKKNRMGQKARRALAEAAFGDKAKHLKTKIRRMRPPKDQRRDTLDSNAREQGVHPSWQAKQELRAKQQAAQFQGAKTKFDFDSD